jgi:ribose transport system substrate-binding protein
MVQLGYGMAKQAQARAVTENILTAHPDLTGLFADNESSSMGAVAALRSRRTTQVRTVIFDSNTALIDELRDRYVDAMIIQDPMKMGYESVRAIAMKLRGETPPVHIDSGVYLVERANLERPEIIPLLYPDVKKYLEPRDR